MTRRLASAALLCACLAPAPAFAQEVGRLFFTPDQRSALDARRKARIPDKPAASVIESAITKVDGLVARDAGRSTVWVNGEPIPEGARVDGVRASARGSGSGRVTVEPAGQGNQVNLKIGQTFDSATGEVKDLVQGGEVKINTRGAKGNR